MIAYLLLSFFVANGQPGERVRTIPCPSHECVMSTISYTLANSPEVYRIQVFDQKPKWVGVNLAIPPIADYVVQ